MIAVIVAAQTGGGDGTATSSTTTAATAASSTAAPSTTTAPATTTTVPAAVAAAMWPFPGTGVHYGTPTAAARSFATDFLRFRTPLVGDFQQGDSRSGEVPIRARAQGFVTTILVRQLGPGDDWSVIGAATPDLEVTSPGVGQEVTSPVHLAGQALAFEGNVQVEVRQDGDLGAIGHGFVTGGGDVKRPFDGTVSFETPRSPYGAIVFSAPSAEDGSVEWAGAVRVAFRSTDIDAAGCGGSQPPRPHLAAGRMEVKVYFNCDRAGGGDVAPRPVYRDAPKSPDVLRVALEALVAGPTEAERSAGYSSWFSDKTASALRSVRIDNGHAVVDFEDLRPLISGASSSAGSALLLSQLDTTVFQFRTVGSVEYRLTGSCEAFNEWLQYGGCERRTRGTSTD